MLKVLFRLILTIVFVVLILIALHLLFNGGVDTYEAMIEKHGFWGAVKEFFKEIWTGFKTTCGIK